MCFGPVTLTEHKRSSDDRDDRLWRTLSGEQDLLSVARQPEPRWSLSVGKHLYPVHELLTPATNQIMFNRLSGKNEFITYKLQFTCVRLSNPLLTECHQAS